MPLIEDTRHVKRNPEKALELGVPARTAEKLLISIGQTNNLTGSIYRVNISISPYLRDKRMRAAANRTSTSAVGLKAFFKIADLWRLTVEDQKDLLGLSSDSTLHKWKKQPESANLDKDTLDRISYVLGIYKDLQTLLPDNESADSWVRNTNKAPMFANRSPLSLMKRGHIIDLYKVRQYLALAKGI